MGRVSGKEERSNRFFSFHGGQAMSPFAQCAIGFSHVVLFRELDKRSRSLSQWIPGIRDVQIPILLSATRQVTGIRRGHVQRATH